MYIKRYLSIFILCFATDFKMLLLFLLNDLLEVVYCGVLNLIIKQASASPVETSFHNNTNWAIDLSSLSDA